ncbi:ParB N-terminal domain-containing protein [Acaryochloris marina NIES-2412]
MIHKKQPDSSITSLNLSDIALDPEIQPRQQLNQEVIAEYAEAMRQGATFPPVVVFHDGSEFWLADGFHRTKAKEHIGGNKIFAEVRSGSRRDSILFAAGANTTHGLHRTNTDKRLVVKRLLVDPEWSQWSDNAIAQKCGVGRTLVGKSRQQMLLTCRGDKSKSRRGSDGRIINISNIGKNRKQSKMRPIPGRSADSKATNSTNTSNFRPSTKKEASQSLR